MLTKQEKILENFVNNYLPQHAGSKNSGLSRSFQQHVSRETAVYHRYTISATFAPATRYAQLYQNK
jgi:hypothetical protein